MVKHSVWILYLVSVWLICHCCGAFSPPYAVIESDMAPEVVVHVVTDANPPIKLKCHELKGKTGFRVDDIVWQYKKCGHGLSLNACEELPKDEVWQFALCRNQTKLCTGSTLPISNPAESDSGLYRCLHKNYMMPKFRVNRTVQLEVRDFRTKSIEILPEDAELDNKTVFENQSAVLRCRVRSVTFPHIVWARSTPAASPITGPSISIGGVLYQFVNASETHVGPDKLYTSKVYVPRAELSHNGVYVCFALDARHQDSKQVTLTVVAVSSHHAEAGAAGYEIWWIAIALVLSATSCTLVLCLLIQRNRPKMMPIPHQDVLEECGARRPTQPS